MNHTFSTIEDDRYEGDETYEAGYSFASGSGGHDLDRHEYCPVTIEDDDNPKVDSVWFNSTPADGHTYRAGEWIEIAAKFNGRVGIDGEGYLGFFFSNSGFVFSHSAIVQYREAHYRRGSGTDTLVFGYQVDVRDRNVDFAVQPRGDTIRGSGTIYGRWTNGTYHREDTALRSLPAGDGEDLSVDGRRYVRSVSVTSRQRVGNTYGRGEKVEVQVTFDREVVVSGLPSVALIVGSYTRGALYASGSGTDVLTFHYEVGENHTDTDGITIRASDSALSYGLVGGSITDEEFGITANRAYSQQWNLSGHKVDGTVERAPSGPIDLTAGAATPTTVPLSWTAPKFDGATAVTGYKVEWSADGNDPWMVAEADTGSTATSYTDTGLTPQTTYHYRVSAINSVGISEASESVSFTTPVVTISAVEVTSQPRVGDTYGRGETVEVQVTFDRVVVVSGLPVVGLTVGGDWRGASYTSGSGTKVLTFHYEIGEDHTDTDGISIRASNSTGSYGFVGIGSSITDEEFGSTANRAYSQQSDLSGHKVDGTVARAPSKPTGLTAGPATPTMVPLSWTAPKFDGATAVTGYKVEWSADGNAPWMVAEADTGSTATSYTDTGLTPQTTYHYRVSAINSVGASEASESVSSTTPALPVGRDPLRRQQLTRI